MPFVYRIIVALSILTLAGNTTVRAQLWRYVNDSPEREKAADMELKREAYSVVTKRTVAYRDTFPYDVMTFAIKSFDGAQAKIDLWEKPFDGHVFHIDLPHDRLVIPDFYCLTKVHHLSNNLLEVVYSPRGGSNDGFDNVLILGVNNNRFCVAAEIQCVHKFDGPNEYGLYNLHLKLQGTNADNYQMLAKVRELLRTTDKKKTSYDRSYTFILKFDKTQHLFYTTVQKLDANFYQDDLNAKKRHVTGVYPTINLGQYRYCFFNKCWCTVWKDTATGEASITRTGSMPAEDE